MDIVVYLFFVLEFALALSIIIWVLCRFEGSVFQKMCAIVGYIFTGAILLAITFFVMLLIPESIID